MFVIDFNVAIMQRADITSRQVQQLVTVEETEFSFEAGGRTFRPVVCHFTSVTLRPILAIFLLLYYIFFLLRHLMDILTRG